MKTPRILLFSLLILLLLAAGIGLAADQIAYPSIPVNQSDTSTTVVHIEFPFMNDTVRAEITLNLAPYYGATTEGVKVTPLIGCLPDRYYSEIAYDPAQDQMYAELFTVFNTYAGEHNLTNDEYVELLTTYVQNIPYKTSETEIKFPIETVIQNWGDCDDKSILLAGLLAKKEYNAGVFVFEEDHHMAAGVKAGDQTEYKNSGYSIIETTRYAYIGEEPALILNQTTGKFVLYMVGEGTISYTASYQVGTILDTREQAYAEVEALYDEMSALSLEIENQEISLKQSWSMPGYLVYKENLAAYNTGVAARNEYIELITTINSGSYNREEIYQTVISMR